MWSIPGALEGLPGTWIEPAWNLHGFCLCQGSASASSCFLFCSIEPESSQQTLEIGRLRTKLEDAEAALQAADQEAHALHLQLQAAEERVAQAEHAAIAAAEAVTEAVAVAVAAAEAAGHEVKGWNKVSGV